MYDSNLKYKWDNQNVLDYAVATAEHKKAIDIATVLKKMGLSFEDIAKSTGLCVQEIEKL